MGKLVPSGCMQCKYVLIIISEHAVGTASTNPVHLFGLLRKNVHYSDRWYLYTIYIYKIISFRFLMCLPEMLTFLNWFYLSVCVEVAVLTWLNGIGISNEVCIFPSIIQRKLIILQIYGYLDIDNSTMGNIK